MQHKLQKVEVETQRDAKRKRYFALIYRSHDLVSNQNTTNISKKSTKLDQIVPRSWLNYDR